MSFPTFRFDRATHFGAVLFLGLAMTGCSSWRLPSLVPFGSGEPKSLYVGNDGAPLRPSVDSMMYQKVREAKAQNAIVLQIADADEPVRVLPLPGEGKSVFVSDLLNQTGVLQKIGRVDATLYRDAAGMPGGLRMPVKMSPGADQVRPESDYSLRPGDRLVVQKAQNPPLNGLLKSLLNI